MVPRARPDPSPSTVRASESPSPKGLGRAPPGLGPLPARASSPLAGPIHLWPVTPIVFGRGAAAGSSWEGAEGSVGGESSRLPS